MGHSEVVDGVIKDGLWDPYSNVHMGICAELCARCAAASGQDEPHRRQSTAPVTESPRPRAAREHSVSRQDQDEFAAESFARAKAAAAAGAFDPEIVPVQVTQPVVTPSVFPPSVTLTHCINVKTGSEGKGDCTSEQGRDGSEGKHHGAAVKVRETTMCTVDWGRVHSTRACLFSVFRLRPAFQKQGGTVTAGNSSGINDGAAALVLVR